MIDAYMAWLAILGLYDRTKICWSSTSRPRVDKVSDLLLNDKKPSKE